MHDSILLERDGSIATLTLNRPASLNALDLTMVDALVEHSAALAADESVRCVVIKGAGRHFMAGGDIKSFAELLSHSPVERQRYFTRMVERVHAAIENVHFRREWLSLREIGCRAWFLGRGRRPGAGPRASTRAAP